MIELRMQKLKKPNQKDTCIMHTEKIHELELKVTRIDSNLMHIKERIETLERILSE